MGLEKDRNGQTTAMDAEIRRNGTFRRRSG
jgi:hypothetical protein